MEIKCTGNKQKKNTETTCGTTSQVASQSSQENTNGCCVNGLASTNGVTNNCIKELLNGLNVSNCNCCSETTHIQEFVKESIKSLNTSGKLLIKEIEKEVLLNNNNENTVGAVKLLKEYTHQVLWFLISYVAVEEYILICNWLCRLTGYLKTIIECVKNQDTAQSTKCCTHLNGNADENCVCWILCNIICLLIKSINRLHKHKREIILRKDTTTATVCTCRCCNQAGEASTTCKSTCVAKTKIQEKEDEYFTVSTKSLDNIRSTILIFYGMNEMIEKCKDKICKGTNGTCTCDEKDGDYAECLSLFSVCCNILKDLSSMKDGTLPMAVTWLSNCMKFVDNSVVDECKVDDNYTCRKTRYSTDSTCNKEKVESVATKYKEMIEAANALGGLDNGSKVNGVANCGSLQSCPTNTEASTCSAGQGCSCNGQQCSCSPPATDNTNNVFKDLCKMMCCNGSGCRCSGGSGNCNSIKSFCNEVSKFMDLVNSVKNGTPASPAPTSPCNCTKDNNCDSCQTRRFIKLVEVYTKELKTAGCVCKPEVGKIIFQIVLDPLEFVFDVFGLISKSDEQKNGQKTKQTAQESNPKFYECKCCKDKNEENCLKDGYKCGISSVMKYFFGCNECKCVDVPETKSIQKRSAGSTKSDEEKHKAELTGTDKLCKCLVKVFKQVADNLQICKDNQKCPCTPTTVITSASSSCLAQCCNSTNCRCGCKATGSDSPVTSPIHLSKLYTLHTVIHVSP